MSSITKRSEHPVNSQMTHEDKINEIAGCNVAGRLRFAINQLREGQLDLGRYTIECLLVYVSNNPNEETTTTNNDD